MSASPQRRMRKVAEKRAVKELHRTQLTSIAERAQTAKIGDVQDMIASGITQYHRTFHTPWWSRLIRYVRARAQARRLARLREQNEEAYDG